MVFLHDSWKIQLWLIKMNICCILPPAGFSLFWHVWSSAFSPPSTSTSPCHRQRSSGWWVFHSPGIGISPSKSGINGAAYGGFVICLWSFHLLSVFLWVFSSLSIHPTVQTHAQYDKLFLNVSEWVSCVCTLQWTVCFLACCSAAPGIVFSFPLWPGLGDRPS